MEGKQVILKWHYSSTWDRQNNQIKGVFQRWGDAIRYYDEKHFSLTIAIVLGEDGNVYTAPPDAVSLANINVN